VSPALQLVLILLCVAGSAFFAGLETGVISINRLRLRHLVQHRVPGARILEDFLRRPEVLLGTTLIGTNLCHVAVAVLAASLASRTGLPGAPALAGIAATIVLLILGEYIPKAWFRGFPSYRTLPFARALWVASWILLPLRWGLAGLVRLLSGRHLPTPENQPLITREEFLHLTREGGETGALSPVETRMIKGVIQMSGTRCSDIMIPRDRMSWVERSTPMADLLDLARREELSRFPVWDPTAHRFVGVVNVFDVLADEAPDAKTAESYMRHPQFVAGHTLADHVMPRMRVTRQPLMLVTDEKGEVTGVVTLDDVLSVIVGSDTPAAAAAKAP
jgi:putative hemolysin